MILFTRDANYSDTIAILRRVLEKTDTDDEILRDRLHGAITYLLVAWMSEAQ
jgi:hypothetical protein